jgi:hypothetical protein
MVCDVRKAAAKEGGTSNIGASREDASGGGGTLVSGTTAGRKHHIVL